MSSFSGRNLCIGVDVGGTNTDVAILRGSKVLGWAKVTTTSNITDGIVESILAATDDAMQNHGITEDNLKNSIARVNIGTTHFINAVIQRRDVVPVSVIRLCGPASVSAPPFIDFPEDLRARMEGSYHLIQGGYQYDGSEITPLSIAEVNGIIDEFIRNNVEHIVISGIFSPVNPEQEKRVQHVIRDAMPDVSMTMSHELGQIGLLERENAAILNESLKPLANRTVQSFRNALWNIGLQCPFYLTQNDGTIASADDALRYPVYTFSSGATNSMRGAAHLSGLKNGIIIDIGGTSSDFGALVKGFPLEASARVKIGGVNTNFRMPNVLSLGLGGGSLVGRKENGQIFVGPESVGYKLKEKALVFGGDVLTTSDIAVAKGLADLGSRDAVASCDPLFVADVMKEIRSILESGIDQMKVAEGECTVCLVGGGSILVDKWGPMDGVARIEKPPYYQVANAIGAAMGQVSGSFDALVEISDETREKVIKAAIQQAKAAAVAGGAIPETVEILEVSETPMTYMVVPVTRLKVKAVGDLEKYDHDVSHTVQVEDKNFQTNVREIPHDSPTSKPEEQLPSEKKPMTHDNEANQEESTPFIDPETGEWVLNTRDVECLAIGTGILGCGGGGSTFLGRLLALKALRDGHKLRVINPNRLKDKQGRIVCIAYMGAPVVLLEKLASGQEMTSVLDTFCKILRSEWTEADLSPVGDDVQVFSDVDRLRPLPKEREMENTPVALMSGEIGGGNGMVPLIIAAMSGLPVVDCDGMGRAFPKLNQFLPYIYGKPAAPAVLGNEKGDIVAVASVTSPQKLEEFFRIKTTEFGCSAATALASLTPEETLSKSCLFSMTRAWRIGDAVIKARNRHSDPVAAILQHENGNFLISGKITDVYRKTESGFNRGHVIIEGTENFTDRKVKINFQNENLMVLDMATGEVLVTCPDLITIVDRDLGVPIMTEETRYGLRVSVLVLPVNPLMQTEEALKVVGPEAFRIEDVIYTSLCTHQEIEPIPPP